MKPSKTRISVTIDTDLAQKIKHLARQDLRSTSLYIYLLLKTHAESQETRPPSP